MALTVNMTQDVRRYETRDLGPFTKRQGIWLFVAVVIGVPIAILLPFPIYLKIIFASAVAAPIGICGFIKPDHTPMEKWVLRVLYRTFLAPRIRRKKNPYSLGLKRNFIDPKRIKYSNKPEAKIYT